MATYLDYAPTPTSEPKSYTSCFERLGFKIAASTSLKRDMLVTYLNAHVGDSVYRILRSTDNEAAFRVMVSEFLVEHGPEYWGASNREHLAEPDVSKGFWYPRDGFREGSSFLKAVDDLFDYKAKACVKHMRKMSGPGWTNKNVDYKAMTGRKADAAAFSSVEPRPTPKPNKRPSSTKDPHEGHDEDENEYTGNNKETRTGSWNIFDQVETKTRLRPSPSITRKWERHVSENEEDGLPPVQRSKVKKRRPRMSAPGFSREPITSAELRKQAGRTAIRKTPVEHDSDSETPLLHKRRRPQSQQFTPPTSHASSATPAVATDLPFIDLDSSPERELPKKQASNDKLSDPNPSKNNTSLATDTNPARIKGEPVFVGYRARTVLRVEASNDDKAPITVPFDAWKTSEQLFSTLIKEQGLRPEVGKKVKQISATYTWNKRRHGIRRGREEDWDRFCKTVQEAWELESDKFEDECEIEMVLHVDE